MAIDMAKAFDTLSNKFLDKVLKFFGFSNNMLKLLGTNCTACIMLENGELNRNFSLGRGRPQGDNISPNTFNFCIQIIIFKLELDNSILPIPRTPTNLLPLLNIPSFSCTRPATRQQRTRAWLTTTRRWYCWTPTRFNQSSWLYNTSVGLVD